MVKNLDSLYKELELHDKRQMKPLPCVTDSCNGKFMTYESGVYICEKL